MSLDLMARGLKLAHLRLLAALTDHDTVSGAAMALGITQPAASRLAREVEGLTGAVLYTRRGRGVRLTEAGRMLAYRGARILREIGEAGRDIEEMRLGLAGHVTVGAVTGPAIDHVLPMIRQVRLSFPAISLSVEVASSDVLARMLLDGALDFALCRLPAGYDAALFHEAPQEDEPVSIIARAGHPLARAGTGPVAAERLLAYDWVLPPPGAILRTTVEGALRRRRLALPARVLTTSSFLFTLAVVRQTNTVAPLASAVARAFADTPGGGAPMVDLDVDLDIRVEPYSLLTRAGQRLTPAAASVFDAVRRSLAPDSSAAET